MEFNLEYKFYIVLFLFLALGLLFTFIYLFHNTSDQSGQSGQSVKKNIDSSNPTLKLYYTNWCGWSKKFLPVWDQLSKLKQINIPMEKIDCEQNKDSCKGIPGFPYVVLEKGTDRIEYKGNRTARDIINFVNNNV
jgi:hypothetical protein